MGMTATDELRAMAESVGLAMPQAATLMMEAADTIWQLRDSVHREREEADRLRDENARLRSCLSDDADNARQIMGENAKLRELLRAAYNCTNAGPSCLECRVVAGGCTLLSAMRELGVEVD